MLQHIGSDGGAEGVGHDNNLVEVVCGEDLRDRETGGLSIKRGTSYPIADWEYLAGSVTTNDMERWDCSTSTIMIPRFGSSLESSRIKGR